MWDAKMPLKQRLDKDKHLPTTPSHLHHGINGSKLWGDVGVGGIGLTMETRRSPQRFFPPWPYPWSSPTMCSGLIFATIRLTASHCWGKSSVAVGYGEGSVWRPLSSYRTKHPLPPFTPASPHFSNGWADREVLWFSFYSTPSVQHMRAGVIKRWNAVQCKNW